MNKTTEGTPSFFRKLFFGFILLSICIFTIEFLKIEITNMIYIGMLVLLLLGGQGLDYLYIRAKKKRVNTQSEGEDKE